MKFQPDIAADANVITRQEAGRIWVGQQPYAHSLLVPRAGEVLRWDVAALAGLTPAHFERIAALRPELVIFGSGARLRFVAPALLRSLIDARIGVETMDTPAACRTFNVLASEGRLVLAALLVESIPPA
ncbi:MAG: Mth938-like domain-containing protein [Burkholderiales bacterium]|nr:Mth938-like domain-containing protein [Burkholderiales bacterium]MDE1927575.1 Mth938-like domain-containing protein [Burkholderiales bacterium]MDE2092825.1 Mth938-like domain-containing protein [Burkholderiales bacterium]